MKGTNESDRRIYNLSHIHHSFYIDVMLPVGVKRLLNKPLRENKTLFLVYCLVLLYFSPDLWALDVLQGPCLSDSTEDIMQANGWKVVVVTESYWQASLSGLGGAKWKQQPVLFALMALELGYYNEQLGNS